MNTANNNETERKSIHPKPESHLFKFSNSMELDALGNLKLDAIALTALHYSANLKPKTSLQSLTAKTSIKYNVKSLTETLIELPNESKNIAIKDPIIENNKTFYINPLPDIKIIGDPILPDAAKIEECPKGNLLKFLSIDFPSNPFYPAMYHLIISKLYLTHYRSFKYRKTSQKAK